MKKHDRRRIKAQPKFCLRRWQVLWGRLAGLRWCRPERGVARCRIEPL